MKTETFTVMDCGELEDLIQEHNIAAGLEAPSDFSVVADLLLGDDSYYVIQGKPGLTLKEGKTAGWGHTLWYVAKLQVFGAIPAEHPVLLVSW